MRKVFVGKAQNIIPLIENRLSVKKKKKKIRCPVLPVLTGHEYLGFFFVSLDLLHCKYTELILSFPFRITSCAKSLIEKNSLHNDLIIL